MNNKLKLVRIHWEILLNGVNDMAVFYDILIRLLDIFHGESNICIHTIKAKNDYKVIEMEKKYSNNSSLLISFIDGFVIDIRYYRLWKSIHYAVSDRYR